MNMNTQEEPIEHKLMNKEVKTEVLGAMLIVDKMESERMLAIIASGLEYNMIPTEETMAPMAVNIQFLLFRRELSLISKKTTRAKLKSKKLVPGDCS